MIEHAEINTFAITNGTADVLFPKYREMLAQTINHYASSFAYSFAWDIEDSLALADIELLNAMRTWDTARGSFTTYYITVLRSMYLKKMQSLPYTNHRYGRDLLKSVKIIPLSEMLGGKPSIEIEDSDNECFAYANACDQCSEIFTDKSVVRSQEFLSIIDKVLKKCHDEDIRASILEYVTKYKEKLPMNFKLIEMLDTRSVTKNRYYREIEKILTRNPDIREEILQWN